MNEFWRKLTSVLSKWRRSAPTDDRQSPPRFICRCEVTWQVGSRRGEGQIRELSPTGLRLRTDRAILAGSVIRIQPKVESLETLAFDVTVGTVVYCRSRAEGMEVGVHLASPERLSRFDWLNQLQRPGGVPRVAAPSGSLPRLRVVSSRDER